MKLMKYIEHILSQEAEKTGKKRSRLIINTGIDPTQFSAYLKANRLLSEDMLERFARTYPESTSLDKLRA